VNKKEMKKLIKTARKLAKPFRVSDDGFRLKDIDPGDTLQFTSEDKPRATPTSSARWPGTGWARRTLWPISTSS
jgi:hypothetical protein